MLSYKSLLFCVLSIFIVPNAADMSCNMGGIYVTCPTIVDADDKIFCCESSSSLIQRCCNFEDYAGDNSALVAGIVISIVIAIIIITISCCCFCSCCYLARRRNQGQVIYVNTTGQPASMPPPAFQQVQPPLTQVYNPSTYDPNYSASQLPLNPYYK